MKFYHNHLPTIIFVACLPFALGGWIGNEAIDPPAASPAVADSTMTSFLIVAGRAGVVTPEGHGPDGFVVQVTNRRSGEMAEGTIGERETGIYEAIFLDLNNNPVAIVGDTLTFVIIGARYFSPFGHIVTQGDIQDYRATVDLQIAVPVPEASLSYLSPCYPNPFNPRTTISFRLETSGRVLLRLYDLAGKAVRTLANEVYGEGDHYLTWDGTDGFGHSAPSGGYLLRLECNGESWVQKLMLLE